MPEWSALKPPKDGITSPPVPRSVAMSLWYRPAAMVCVLSPFQVGTQEPLVGVWMNASVRYRAPDCWAIVEMLSVVHASKYGA